MKEITKEYALNLALELSFLNGALHEKKLPELINITALMNSLIELINNEKGGAKE